MTALFNESVATCSLAAGLSVLVHEKMITENKKRKEYFITGFLLFLLDETFRDKIFISEKV